MEWGAGRGVGACGAGRKIRRPMGQEHTRIKTKLFIVISVAPCVRWNNVVWLYGLYTFKLSKNKTSKPYSETFLLIGESSYNRKSSRPPLLLAHSQDAWQSLVVSTGIQWRGTMKWKQEWVFIFIQYSIWVCPFTIMWSSVTSAIKCKIKSEKKIASQCA